MNTIKLIAVSPLFFSALLLSGCGGEQQDQGTASTSKTKFSGVVIDGALARSTVYLDSNNNATRDPWEDYAFTDNDGYYSYNPKTKKNYCADDTDESEKIYCLTSARSYADVIVRIDGGYDLLTGEPFLGQMSRRVDMSEVSDSVDSVISPLTSLLTNITTSDDKSRVLNSLRINESDLNVNYLDSDDNGRIDSKLLNASLKIHKTVTIMADRLNDNYSALNDESGVMNDPSSEVYKNLARELSDNSTAGLDYVLQDSQSLTRILDRSEGVIRGLFENKKLVLPADMGDEQNRQNFTRVVEVTRQIPNVIDQLINPIVDLTHTDAVGGARALEALVIKSVNENNTNHDSTIESAVEFFTRDDRSLVRSLTTALAGSNADVTSLSSNSFSGDQFNSEEGVTSASVLANNAQAFNRVVGMQMRVSDLDLGSANALKDIEIEFYFTGTVGALDGRFTACAKYIEDAKSDGRLGDGNTRGERVKGFWTKLGATQNNQDSYSLLLTIEFLGTTYQAIMKTVGDAVIENTEYRQVRFDNSGEYRIWHSRGGMVESENIPKSNADCEARLPSRVGI